MLASIVPLVLLAVSAQNALPAHCNGKVTVRREVHDMNADDIKIYKETIRAAITTPDPALEGMSIWKAAASLHYVNAGHIHGGAEFFFWHRMFLATIEQKLQAINPKFYFPYWDSDLEYKHSQWTKSLALQISNLDDTIIKNNRNPSSSDMPSGEMWSNLFQRSMKGNGFVDYSEDAEALHGNL
ncbi:hypothetical protein HDV03_001667 [Kappamyces sp. JEL0829]|nr:hypothetical protein HDV03_001667 [Kappamyces sp. JEL0829]